ncbi:MAG: hypothetical protein NC908_04255 [Candidatus Omnitrophica bacterium]|nr:hypothetical protein [Candidatus Omnitrophota bacterium]
MKIFCFIIYFLWVIPILVLPKAGSADEKTTQLAASAVINPAPGQISPLPNGMEGRISLDLRNIDVVDALKFFSLKTGIDIITTKLVTGRVTLMVEDAPVKDVFDIMLRSNNLAYAKEGEIYNVMTQEEYKALYGKNFADVRQVKVFRLQYAIPEHIFSLIDLLKSDIGRVLVNPESGSVLIIDSPEKIEVIERAIHGFEEQNVVKVFKLNYARAKDVEESLKTQLDLKKVGLIKSDERSNQVIVQTFPERMKQIEELIAELDCKTKEIIIEATIVKVKLSDDLEKGIEWEGLFDIGRKYGLMYFGSYPFSAVQSATDAWRSRKEVLQGGLKVSVSGTTVTSYYEPGVGYVGSYPFSGTATNYAAGTKSTGMQEMHLGVIGKHDFDTVFKFLQTIGQTRILSNPKLAVVNNQEAKIHVGQKEAYVTTTTTTGQTTSTVSEQITFVDVGVMLSVVPNINEEGYVILKVKAEISSVIDTLITPTKNQIPIIDTSLAETTVMVKEGSTIIIGGLRKEQEVRTTRQTPWLGKVPVLGNIFSVKSKAKERTELLIILTPKLITGDTLVMSATGEITPMGMVKPVKDYLTPEGQRTKDSFSSEVFVPLDSKGLEIKGPK